MTMTSLIRRQVFMRLVLTDIITFLDFSFRARALFIFAFAARAFFFINWALFQLVDCRA